MCNSKNKLMAPVCVALSMFAIVATVSAHEKHDAKTELKPESEIATNEKAVLTEINAEYLKSVKPIFQKSCFDCHSGTTNYPWYKSIPGVKQLIQSDIKEARTHLDLSDDFPFTGHGTPVTDLEAIRGSVKNGSMPPFRYRIMHSKNKMSDEERKATLLWIEQSLGKLSGSDAAKHAPGH